MNFFIAQKLARDFATRKDEAMRQIQQIGLHRLAGLACRLLGAQPHSEPGALADWQIDTLRAIQERMCGYRGDDLPAPAACGALPATVQFVSWMPRSTRQQFADLLTVFEAGSIFLRPHGHRLRFTLLDEASADAYLATWDNVRVVPMRGAFQALKSVCMMGYWTRPGTWGAIGYDLRDNPGVPDRVRPVRPAAPPVNEPPEDPS